MYLWIAEFDGVPRLWKINSTSSLSTTARPIITGAEPQLFVADITTACNFIVKKLGFVIGFTYGTPPYYAQVKRAGALINLRCVEGPVIDPKLRDQEELLSATLTVRTPRKSIGSPSNIRRLA